MSSRTEFYLSICMLFQLRKAYGLWDFIQAVTQRCRILFGYCTRAWLGHLQSSHDAIERRVGKVVRTNLRFELASQKFWQLTFKVSLLKWFQRIIINNTDSTHKGHLRPRVIRWVIIRFYHCLDFGLRDKNESNF